MPERPRPKTSFGCQISGRGGGGGKTCQKGSGSSSSVFFGMGRGDGTRARFAFSPCQTICVERRDCLLVPRVPLFPGTAFSPKKVKSPSKFFGIDFDESLRRDIVCSMRRAFSLFPHNNVVFAAPFRADSLSPRRRRRQRQKRLPPPPQPLSPPPTSQRHSIFRKLPNIYSPSTGIIGLSLARTCGSFCISYVVLCGVSPV